jgi:hypothetical protein
MVRIHFAPAASVQTFGPSRAATKSRIHTTTCSFTVSRPAACAHCGSAGRGASDCQRLARCLGGSVSPALWYRQLHAIVRTQLGGPPTVARLKVLILRLQPRAETLRPEGVRRPRELCTRNCPSGMASGRRCK